MRVAKLSPTQQAYQSKLRCIDLRHCRMTRLGEIRLLHPLPNQPLSVEFLVDSELSPRFVCRHVVHQRCTVDAVGLHSSAVGLERRTE